MPDCSSPIPQTAFKDLPVDQQLERARYALLGLAPSLKAQRGQHAAEVAEILGLEFPLKPPFPKTLTPIAAEPRTKIGTRELTTIMASVIESATSPDAFDEHGVPLTLYDLIDLPTNGESGRMLQAVTNDVMELVIAVLKQNGITLTP